MGVSLDSKVLIAGYRPAIFKSALQGYARTLKPGNLIDLKGIFPLRRDGAVVFEECLDRGLIDAESHDRTPAGEVIASSKAQARTPLSKADAVLDQLLDRADGLNADIEQIAQVDEVWLFGSVMRREGTVGDIDLAIRTSRKAPYRKDHEARARHAKMLVGRLPDAPGSWSVPWMREGWLRQRMLFGPRRHPLLAGAQDDTTDLASLAVPCRLIYDRQRGGRVDDPILDRHPDAVERDPALDPPSRIPDLTPAPLRPMDARWVAGYESYGTVSPYDIFRGWTDDAHRLFETYPQNLRVAADGHALHAPAWEPKRLKRSGLDGRSALLLLDATEWSGLSLVLNRSIDIEERDWTLRVSFSDIQLYKSRTRIEYGLTPHIVGTVALILAVDAERMCRRAREVASDAGITIKIQREGLLEDIQWFVVDPIIELLRSRAIRIEPESWNPMVDIQLA